MSLRARSSTRRARCNSPTKRSPDMIAKPLPHLDDAAELDTAPSRQSSRKNVVRVHNAWYAACESSELGSKKPLACTILDTPLALFRGPDGAPGALFDRCP